MSRSRKGAKGPGYEFNRRREGKAGYTGTGPFAKKVGNRAQRRLGKKDVKEQGDAGNVPD